MENLEIEKAETAKPENANPENSNPEITKKKLPLNKIIIPLVIVLIVGGIWVAKNMGGSGGITGDDGVFLPENADFAFFATEDLDMEALKEYGLPIILDFGSDTCPPCREMAPILRKVHKDLQGKAIIKYVDLDELMELTGTYPVRAIPTQFLFDKDGNPFTPEEENLMSSRLLMYTTKDTEEHVLTAHEGFMSEEQLLDLLEQMGM